MAGDFPGCARLGDVAEGEGPAAPRPGGVPPISIGPGSWLPVIQVQSRPAISRASQSASASSRLSAAARSSKLSPRQITVPRRGGLQIAVQLLQRGLRLVGRQQRAAAAGEAFGFAEVQVGDAQQLPARASTARPRAGCKRLRRARESAWCMAASCPAPRRGQQRAPAGYLRQRSGEAALHRGRRLRHAVAPWPGMRPGRRRGARPAG